VEQKDENKGESGARLEIFIVDLALVLCGNDPALSHSFLSISEIKATN
jgi:hypothetical protein